MPSDPLDLLRAENPLPAPLPGLPLEIIRQRLDREPPVPRRQKRLPRLPATATGILALIGTVIVVLAVALPILLVGRNNSGHNHPPQHASTNPPGLPPRQELRYIAEARIRAENRPGSPCRSRAPYLPVTTHNTPGPALLSTVGALRRPRTRQDRLPVTLQGLSGGSIYIDYVRRARVTAGVSYYVVPVTAMLFSQRRSPACYRAIRVALESELPQIPPRLRAPTLAFEGRLATYQLRLERQDTHPGVCLVQSSTQGQAASCGDTVDQLKHLGLISMPGVLAGIVPDGVHSVTVDYPRAGGRPAQTTTATVIGNVFVTQIQRGCTRTGSRTFRPAMIWRSASGRIMRKIPSLGLFSGIQTASQSTVYRPDSSFC
jgi:hypothetical protein